MLPHICGVFLRCCELLLEFLDEASRTLLSKLSRKKVLRLLHRSQVLLYFGDLTRKVCLRTQVLAQSKALGLRSLDFLREAFQLLVKLVDPGLALSPEGFSLSGQSLGFSVVAADRVVD